MSAPVQVGEVRSYLVSAASWLFVTQVAAMVIALLLSVLLARVLGVDGYGIYAYAMAWVALLATVAVFGMDRLVVREVAAQRARAIWPLARGLLRRSTQLVAVGSVLAAAAAIALTLLLSPDSPLRLALVIAFAMLPPLALTRLRQATLESFQRPVLARIPDMILRPVLLGLLVGGGALLNVRFDAPIVMGLTWVTVVVTLLVVAGTARLGTPAVLWDARPNYRTREWTISALGLFAVGGVQIVLSRIDVVLLGLLVGAEEAGIYSVATNGADLVAFVLVAVAAAIAPVFARLQAGGHTRELEQVVVRTSRTVLALSLFPALVLVVFGRSFLLLFGDAFTAGQTALSILVVGQLVNVGAGPVALLLTMTGAERAAAAGLAIGALLNVVLNLMLIPLLGIEGAALGTALSVVVWNLVLVRRVRLHLGIRATALSTGTVHHR